MPDPTPPELVGTVDAATLLAAVDATPVRDGEPETLTLTWWDTPDWRVLRTGRLIEHATGGRSGEVSLLRLGGTTTTTPAPAPARPRSGAALPLALLDPTLPALLAPRYAVPVCSTTVRRSRWRLLDGERKTLARVVADETGADDGTVTTHLRVTALRGYDREVRRALAPLRRSTGAAPEPLLVAAAREQGVDVGADPTRLDDLAVTRRQATRKGVTTVLQRLDDALRATLPGTLVGVDTEFLHDHRVAVRRTRSALKLLAGGLPVETRSRYAPEFRWLGDVTTPVRDLDVFLLDLPGLAQQLPEAVRGDLEPFVAYLARARRRAQTRLVHDLTCDRAEALRTQWAAELAAGLPGPAPDGAPERLGVLAADRLRAASRAVDTRGDTIDDASPAESLHDLRKRGKELRYVLELLGPVFPAGDAKAFVKELKALQDVLGLFQDLEVQAAAVRAYAQAMTDQGAVPTATLLAMGQLAGELERGTAAQREAFAATWTRYAAAAARLLPRLVEVGR